MKACITCGVEKSSDEFHVDKRNSDGYANECKECKRARSRANWKANNPYDPVKERARRLMKRYQITPEQYDEMYEEQEGKCAICGEELPDKPHIDHCHLEGIVRGLLCLNCNVGLGMFRDSIEILQNAIIYLQEKSPVLSGDLS